MARTIPSNRASLAMMTTNRLRQFEVDLRQAFPANPPLDVLAQCDCEECTEIQQDFAGFKWADLPDSTILKHIHHLALIGDEAFRYFLPAFMRAGVALPDSDISEFLMQSLAPSGLHASELSKFSDVQRRMVVSYLDILASAADFPQDKVWKKTRARWQSAGK